MVTDIDDPGICRTLLHRAGRGDTAAFAELYDRTSPAVFGMVRSILVDVGQSEDVTREVYLQVWRTASHYGSDHDDPSILLMTLARHHAVGRLRAGAPGQPLPAVSAAHIADLVDRWACAHQVAAMPVASREILALVYLRGQQLSEVAETLRIPETTVLSRLREALSALRQGNDGRSAGAPSRSGKTSRLRTRQATR